MNSRVGVNHRISKEIACARVELSDRLVMIYSDTVGFARETVEGCAIGWHVLASERELVRLCVYPRPLRLGGAEI